MFKVLIEGFKTEAQAKSFIAWYEGQGEQDASVWFDCDEVLGIDSMNTNLEKTYPLKLVDNTFTMVVDPR